MIKSTKSRISFLAHANLAGGPVKEPNIFHNYETEKIPRKASDAAEKLQL